MVAMSSHSLYRKWRSKSFEDVMGQQHVVQTLRNAVRHDRVAHAYLFTGPRGTGKTSTARILAKAVNCTSPQDGAPCGQCDMCLSIGEGRSPDVIEIDGASNNGIDDIRILRERVAFTPAEARFKLYIIDEVHRLSGAAFDGLLKTLEEPPRHVIFIFASTEPHKVPTTILSRCQRFDFHRIDRETTIARLSYVAEKEGIQADQESTQLIAQQSGGSLRDALGILDQVRAFAGDSITATNVRDSIGLGSPGTVSALTTAILDAAAGDCLRLIHDAVAQGADPRTLSLQLIEYWRALLLHVSGASGQVDIDPALEEAATGHASRLTADSCLAVLRALTEQIVEPRLSVSPQLPFEMATVQAISVLQISRPPTQAVETPVSAQRPSPAPKSEQTRRVMQEPRDSSGYSGSKMGPSPSSNPVLAGTESLSEPGSGTESHEDANAQEPDAGAARTENLPEAWPQVVEAARARSRRLQGLLRDARLVEWSPTEVTLGFRHGFHREETDRPENRAAVEAIIADVTGGNPRVRCVIASPEPATGGKETAAADDTGTFIEDAERMLRGVHARQVKSSRSIT